jgi:hypothetical protein
MVSITFANTTETCKVLTVVGLAFYLAFFSCAMGPGGWLIPSEVFAMCIRAKAMSVATFLNRLAATIMATTFLSVAHILSWTGFFLLLAAVCLVGAGFLYVYLPETRGRSLEDISVDIAKITGDRFVLDLEEKVRQDRQRMTRLETPTQSYGSVANGSSSNEAKLV